MEPIKIFEVQQVISLADKRLNPATGIEEHQNTFQTRTRGNISPAQALDALVILTKTLMNEAGVEDPMTFLAPLVGEVLGCNVMIGEIASSSEEERKIHAKFSN